MTAMDSIFSRRSIRSYTGEALTQAEIEQILRACYAAPVGMGRFDSLHITVVKSSEYLAQLEAEAGRQLGKEDYHPLYGAPVLMIFSSVFPGIPTDNSSYSNCAILAQNAALAAVAPQRLFALSTRGTTPYDRPGYAAGDAFLFGRETSGLPDAVLEQIPEPRRLRLPMRPGNRSLNLSNAVAVVVFEAWRQLGHPGGA